jgi:prolyl 3-hydroxylase /prolyl 3,4-dihydroxylase
MAPTRFRSPSPVAPQKRLKPNLLTNDSTMVSRFAEDLLTDASAMKLQSIYQHSEPFKYCVLDKLFEDNLLKRVKDECIGELSFTEKTTDIYRVSSRAIMLVVKMIVLFSSRFIRPETLRHYHIFQKNN